MNQLRPCAKTLSVLVFAFFLSISAIHADLASDVRLSEALHTETIPHLKFENARFPDAVAAIAAIWNQAHPKQPFPVGYTDYDDPTPNDGYNQRISLDLHEVTYITALRFIGDLMYCHLSEKRGFIALHQIHGIVEDWRTFETELPPAALRGLGLRAESTPTEVQGALKKLGVAFPDGMKALLVDSGKRIVVTTTQSEIPKLDGIILLLSNGYKITK
jgi:hypothetical protein